jgi:16S rRNA (guanine(527)-N(7))-methyltransferase RsmG
MLTLIPSFKKYENLFSGLTSDQISRLDTHFQILQDWNEKIALVSRKSIQNSFSPHYADSVLTILKTVHFKIAGPYFDVGTGAGFPGLIFAILFPDKKITLYEKTQKKHLFLADVVEKLNLKNVVLKGLLDREKLSGLIYARAVFSEDSYFTFFKNHLLPGSVLVRNLGGKDNEFKLPKDFSKIKEEFYSLPDDFGNRKIEVYKFVPRGT